MVFMHIYWTTGLSTLFRLHFMFDIHVIKQILTKRYKRLAIARSSVKRTVIGLKTASILCIKLINDERNRAYYQN